MNGSLDSPLVSYPTRYIVEMTLIFVILFDPLPNPSQINITKKTIKVNETLSVKRNELNTIHLKEMIWNTQKKFFDSHYNHSNFSDLTLWKVENLCEETEKWESLKALARKVYTETDIKDFGGNKLLSGSSFSYNFQDVSNDSIRIIVQPPQPATTGKRSLDDSDDRKSINMKRPRSFAPSNRVHDDINYYIEPKETIEKLGNFLREGKFCLLYGHRQSGKTTTAYAIADWLVNNHDKEVYTISFGCGIVINDGLEKFWESVCFKLRSLDENRFSFDEQEEMSSSTFESLFSKLNHPKETILIVDGASRIYGNDAIIQSFIGSLRSLKDGYHNQFNLCSILLVGTEHIREFLNNNQRVNSASIISPFSAETSLISTRFTLAEICELLHQYSSHTNFELDENGISWEIYSLTHGHKGLVGSLCYYIESNIMVDRHELTCDDWNKETYNLTTCIREKATYASIVRSLPYLSKNQRNILGRVLLHRTYVGSEDDPDVRFLLGEGMVIVEKKLGHEDVLLACSAPILRNIFSYEISMPEIKLSEEAPNPVIDPKWLLERTIENLPIQHIFTKKVLNKTTNEPSEYAFETVFISILKQLLAQSYQSYPNSFYRALPEVKEYNDDSGDPHLHLDILLKDIISPRPAYYGYELVTVATKKVFDEHVKSAEYYSKLHNCSSMYLVHLCNTESFKLNNYFGQECSDVTPVHVIYDKNNGSAKLIYKNDRTDLIIKDFKWKVIWG